MNDWAPERIWLQRGMGEQGSHTWCENPIGEVRTDGDDIEEVEYVRVDKIDRAAILGAAVRAARMLMPEDRIEAFRAVLWHEMKVR